MIPFITAAAGAAATTIGSHAIDLAVNMLKEAPKGGNVVGYGRAGLIMPRCLVDESCATSDMLADTLQTLQATYAAHWLRAFSMHNISVGGSTIHQRLDKFNTHRDPGAPVMRALGLEDFEGKLPDMEDAASEVDPDLKDLIAEGLKIEEEALKMMAVACEAASLPGQTPAGQKGAPGSTIFKAPGKQGNDGATIEKSIDVSAPVNLAGGLTVNVKVSEDGNTVTVPITVRLNAMYMAPDPLVSILGFNAKDITFGARYKKWRLDGIDFWKDLVLCEDLIREHEKNLKADKTGVYLQMMNRRRQNNLAAILSGSVSANSASNIVVLSEESAAALELKAGGRLADFRFRERIFDQGAGVMMAVISQRRGRVRFYTRMIPEYTEVSERDMKASNKSNGPDVGDILSAFRAGSSFRM